MLSVYHSFLSPYNCRTARMEPCDPKTNCYCFHYLLNESKSALLNEFHQKWTKVTQKQYVYGMLSSSSDDDGYLRCFKNSDNLFLCRDGISKVLRLTHRKKQSIIPSSKLISKRYWILCLSEIFQALVTFQSSILHSCCIPTENLFAGYVKWSSPIFVEAIKKVTQILSYSGKDGISTFCSHLGITKALKNEESFWPKWRTDWIHGIFCQFHLIMDKTI
jgi:hypothetical protein